MRKLSYALGIACALLLTIASCSKEAGPQGPAGTNGINGKDGNANVKVYLYNRNDTMMAAHDLRYYLNDLTQSYIDSSLILVYYKNQNNQLWYPSPGFGPDNLYQTKWYNGPGYITLRIMDPNGGTYTGSPQVSSATKIVIAKGSEFGKKEPVDFSNYKATMRYFGLKE